MYSSRQGEEGHCSLSGAVPARVVEGSKGAMTLIALTALAVAILSQSSTQKPGFFTEILRLTL